MITLRDELYLAPVKEPHAVLDIGTGTGIWAIEFGTFYKPLYRFSLTSAQRTDTQKQKSLAVT
jgi:ubiquinone/menaquinone biosynthesis C-methylase UbiE